MKYIYILLLAIKEIYLYVAFLLTTGGRDFAECSYTRQRARCTRQSPLGKNFLGKGSLSSAFYWGTRQNKKQFCRVLGAALGFGCCVSAVNGYFAECPNQHSAKIFFFLKLLCLVPQPRHSAKFFFIFF